MLLQKLRFFLFHVLFTMSFGFIIYLSFRSKSIIMFHWINIFENSSQLDTFREYLFRNFYPPYWLIYSLPDGLWVYALISTLFVVLGKDIFYQKFWLIVAIILGPLIEYLQFLKLFPGTFDIVDLLFYFIGSILSLTIIKFYIRKNEKQNY